MVDLAVVLYRRRFVRLLAVTMAIEVPVQAFSTVVLLSAQPDGFTPGVTGGLTPTYDTGSATLHLAAFVVILAVSVVSTAFVTAVCTRITADAYVDRSDGRGVAFRGATRRVFALTGLALMLVLAQGAGAAACLVGIVVPITVFAVAIPALILEDTGVFRAMGRSFELTKQHFLRVLGLVVTAHLLERDAEPRSRGRGGRVVPLRRRLGRARDHARLCERRRRSRDDTIGGGRDRRLLLRSADPQRGVRRAAAHAAERRSSVGRAGSGSVGCCSMTGVHAGRAAQAVDPDGARDAAHDILSDRRFHRDPAPRPLRGPLRWLGDRLQSVADAVGKLLRPVPGLVWLAIGLAAIAVVVWQMLVIGRRRRVSGAGSRSTPTRGGAATEDPDALERAADDAERRGELERAVRLRFRAGLLRLGGRGAITYRPSVTTAEVRHTLGSQTFDELARTFEGIAYGGRQARPPDVDAARRDWPRVLEDAHRP